MAALITRFETGPISSTTQIGTLDIDAFTNVSYQAMISGSLAGTLELWVSNDKSAPFVKRDDADLAVSGGQNYLVEVVGIATAYCRFVMNVTSGSGSIILIPCAKGIG